jgi:hypothetical protein
MEETAMYKSLICLYGLFLILGNAASAPTVVSAVAENRSYPTRCAEEDNVSVTFHGAVHRFSIEATHPRHTLERDTCDANFSACASSPDPAHIQEGVPGKYELFNDGATILQVVRESVWWQKEGMSVDVAGKKEAANVHRLALYRRIKGQRSWPQVLVLYADGNLRLKPHPHPGMEDTCFGSSVVVGPIRESGKRRYANVRSVSYRPSTDTFIITYPDGTYVLKIDEVNGKRTRVTIEIRNIPGHTSFAAFQSMFVDRRNSDASAAQWIDRSGMRHINPILDFPNGEVSDVFFLRPDVSRHNSSAPDIRLQF